MLRGLLRVSIFSIVWAATIAASSSAEFSGVVDDVPDGDDIVLCDDDGSCRRIRLCGIDAPEEHCPGYKESKEALREIAEGRMARCIQVGSGTPCDSRSKPTNRGRIVAQCFVDGADVADSLVGRGVACDWKRFSGGYYSRNGKGRACPKDH